MGGAFPADKVEDAWNNISLLAIAYNDVSNVKRVVEIALALKRQNAYDAAYIALAEELGAELWALDGPLYRNAHGLGFAVHLVSYTCAPVRSAPDNGMHPTADHAAC